jgi:hypothetical protein
MAGEVEQQGALDIIRTFLHQYGLDSLADWAWDEIRLGKSPSQVQLDLRQRPEFKQRFPAIDERQKAGLPPISPEAYVQYEENAAQIMRAAGFPPSFYDQPEDFHNWVAKDVSISEVSQRAQVYQQAAYNSPFETRQQLKNLYGVDEGGIAAYFADPNRALPILQQQFASAQIAGEAQRQGFGQLGVGEAQRLAKLGISDTQAAQGFGQVAGMKELFQTLPGESQVAPGRQDALGLVAGDAQSQQAVDMQARRRKAAFTGGGGYASGQAGVTGLGSANS